MSPLLTVPGLAFQGCGMFVLPFAVGLTASLFFEVSEVAETLPTLLGFTAFLLTPIALAQLVGLVLKSRKELAWWTERGDRRLRRRLDVLYRHVRVVTVRGWTLLISGLGFTVMALSLKWATFGLLAIGWGLAGAFAAVVAVPFKPACHRSPSVF